MSRDDDALARRAAREARKAAMRARSAGNDGDGEAGDDSDGALDPIRAAREAATAAAVGAAVGAMRALTARRRDGEEELDGAPPVDEDEEEEAAPELQDEHEEPEPEPEPQERDRDGDRGRRQSRPREAAGAGQVERIVQAAREQLRQLNGAEAEGVSSFSRTRDGWRVTLEVVEVRRIPETTDVLASYAVELDDDGGLVAYERVHRYQRSEALGES